MRLAAGTGKAGRMSAAGTVFAWRTRGYGLMISRLHEMICVPGAAAEYRHARSALAAESTSDEDRTETQRNVLPWSAVHVRGPLFQARTHFQERVMKPKPIRLSLLLCLSVVLAAALLSIPGKAPAQAADQVPDGPTKLLRFADISKDKVVFAYAGDLWISSRDGGSARRLTSHVGDELYPKFSPDGKWIAFTGEYDGNPDVYVISAEGGEPKRLTSHPSNDIVLGWKPDGKNILFRSDRFSAPPGRFTKLFLVSPQGGTPKPLQVPRASLTTFSPDGTKIAYLETAQEF